MLLLKGMVSQKKPEKRWEKLLWELGKDKAFFYVTLDPERALGLEDILPNYTIICPYKSQFVYNLRDRVNCIQVFVLEEHLSAEEVKRIVERGTYGILQSDLVKSYINTICHIFLDRERYDKNKKGAWKEKKAQIIVLKNSQLVENFCSKQGWKLLAPKAKVAEQFENKISQYRLLNDIVPYPKSFITNLGEMHEKIKEAGCFRDFKGESFAFTIRGLKRSPPCVERKQLAALALSDTLVLQFNRGHSGNSTYFIKSRGDLEKLYKLFPNRQCKISQYIKGTTYTLNCVVLKNGEVITGSLSEQITGLKSATNNPNTTCGNDFSSPGSLKKARVKRIQEIARKVGKVLHKKDYRGLFGIDVIIENSSGRIYFIEVNTHQPASISFEAKLHRKIGKMPLLAYLMLDYMGCPTPHIGNPPIILPFFAKQIIYRNKSSKALTLNDVEKTHKDKGLLARIKYIKPNEEIYRVQKLKGFEICRPTSSGEPRPLLGGTFVSLREIFMRF